MHIRYGGCVSVCSENALLHNQLDILQQLTVYKSKAVSIEN